MNTFQVSAIPAPVLAQVREQGVDQHGNPVRSLVNTESQGAPLRCCLREAEVGEQIALIAYRPENRGGAYAEVGPIFVHPHDCGGYRDTDRYPPAFRHRRQLLRAYDRNGHQFSNTLVEGAQADAELTALLANPEIDFVHSRNPMAGCYMFRISRSS
ncbi:DUF1203 domain-containing protein [Kineosporia rhizophila]|uniref:DUF1203 domain-containing protein n=1 Tax=Kineosporia TaxID=49184 RepID=UPI000A68F199|nr:MULTISPECIES: DUF1203 domain-containing protein [Kineosporia]MCE0535403.1 DUF1203 domain-containing protein [Kineosporia rhizophila]GLY16815.1 hypothetical protein Kisp01_38300 [Kineosporia sp. NBRC 101677]